MNDMYTHVVNIIGEHNLFPKTSTFMNTATHTAFSEKRNSDSPFAILKKP